MKKFTEEELKEYWIAICPECGWHGLSRDCNGFGSFADPDDFEEGRCLKCNSIIEDFEDFRITLKIKLKWIFRKLTLWKLREDIKFNKYLNRLEKGL